jgi:hypothetical protein
MSDPVTPKTEAGRALLKQGETNDFTYADIAASILAIEAEAVALSDSARDAEVAEVLRAEGERTGEMVARLAASLNERDRNKVAALRVALATAIDLIPDHAPKTKATLRKYLTDDPDEEAAERRFADEKIR